MISMFSHDFVLVFLVDLPFQPIYPGILGPWDPQKPWPPPHWRWLPHPQEPGGRLEGGGGSYEKTLRSFPLKSWLVNDGILISWFIIIPIYTG